MRQNYFHYNGKQYYTGTVIKLKKGYSCLDAVFEWCDPANNTYAYRMLSCIHIVDKEWFNERIVGISKETPKPTPVVSAPIKTNICGVPKIESNNGDGDFGLVLGWMWYIFLMVLATIFNDNVALWALISIIFFIWKAKR